MDKLVVTGGPLLEGEISVSGSKNTALPLMAAAIVAGGPVRIDHVPALKDIHTFSRVVAATGTRVEFDTEQHSILLDSSSLDNTVAPYELVKRMRASFYMLGALIGKEGHARVSLPGGCAWGPRPVDLHLRGLKAMGAQIDMDQGYVVARAPVGGLPGGICELNPSSVGATVNLLLAAITARGTTEIRNAAVEPDVVVFCDMLSAMGARIDGKGTNVLVVEGTRDLSPVNFRNCPDRIELGTFMITAAMAGKPGAVIKIRNANPDHLGHAFLEAFGATGTRVELKDRVVEVHVPDELAPVNIETGVYPGFPTDLQAQWTVLLSRTTGNSKVRETVYPDRFKHIPELRRMGVNAIIVGNEVVIEGKNRTQGTNVMSTDLRAGVSLVLAGLVAEGETHIQRVYHLDRGYENLEGKLSGLGADIRRVKYDEWADPS
jgi:UDP-N-acetylglucosamine 1-carboxyvinyltransferase